MKIRSDFVSNSSSSSFIITNSFLFDTFEITKADICDAVMELYGRDKFNAERDEELATVQTAWEKAMRDNKPDEFEYNYAKERHDELEKNGFSRWKIYDLSNEDDRTECHRRWDKHLDDWDASKLEKSKEYDKFLDSLTKVGLYGVRYAKDKSFRDDYYDRQTGTYRPIPDFIVKTALFMRKNLEIFTMKEILYSAEDSGYMIHFDDNEVWNLAGMADESSEWETEYYTTQRFYEVLLRHLISAGKIDLTDEKLLEYWKVPEDHWWKRDANYKDREYFFDKDKPSMKDLIEMLDEQSIGHEG